MAVVNKMASIQVLPLNNYANGSRTSSAIEVASDVVSIDFDILCNTVANPAIWPNVTTVLTITPEVSTDGGVTWVEAGKSVTPGGPHLTKTGGELQSVRSGGYIPPQLGGVPRQYRVSTEIVGGPLRSSANVEVN